MLNPDWELPPTVILKYYLFQATQTFGFFWPVFTIFLLYRGLDYTQIGLLGSVSAGFVVIGEIPTGYIGDRIGRRNSLLIGSVLLAASVLGFIVAETFAAFVVLWILWALGLSFQSGSGDAWLYDTLQDQLREEEFTRVRGRGGSVNQWLSAGTMLVAGVLYSIDPRLPFLAGGLLLASAVPILLTMPESGHHAADEEGEDEDEEFTVFQAIPVIREKLSEPPLRSFIIYMALFFAIINAADEFIQPIATYRLGLPEEGLGPLYTAFSVVAAIASYYAGAIEEYLSTRWAVLLIPVVVAVFFLIPLFLPLAAFPLFFVMKSGNTVMRPIASGFINKHTESLGRATVLSAASMVYALARLPLKPLIGAVADLWTPLVAVGTLGVLFLVCGSMLYAVEAPAGNAEQRTSTSSD